MFQPAPKKKYVPTAKEKKNLEDASSNKNMRPPFTSEERKKMKNYSNMGKAKSGTTMKKAKSGFAALAPPYDKATFADKIAGATKNKAKSGKTIKKAQGGTPMVKSVQQKINDNNRQINMSNAESSIKKNMAGTAKSGGKMKKCKYGCK